MPSDILRNIDKLSDTLTNSQKVVAGYVSDNISTIAFNTLDELAMKIGVSTTTVIRFARALGYSGYSDMQQDIRSSIKEKVGLPERFSDAALHLKRDQLLMDSFKNEIDNLNRTLSGLSEDLLKQAIDNIIRANHIYIVGMRGAFSIAHLMASRLGQVKERVHLVQAVGDIYPEEISGAQTGDLCIAFMFPRYSKMTASLVSAFRKRGVSILLFTSPNNIQVKPYGDLIIPCVVQGISVKNSFVAPLAVVNYLVTAVTMENPTAKESLAKTEDMLSRGYYLGL